MEEHKDMRIIISPAKKMNIDTDIFRPSALPVFLEKSQILLDWLRTLSYEEARVLWKCNDNIARLNYQRIRDMDLCRNLTPALISYVYGSGSIYRERMGLCAEPSLYSFRILRSIKAAGRNRAVSVRDAGKGLCERGEKSV